ncbi:nuclease-related domain-containing protein [Phytohalomonas tamaricis]|uniref:nuclease-related domain-containing protein n=1 Tax=Phytohalomonas tamaricis TaxID=2081032 RepID=UPI000D0B0625|nr:nuclease-related domain-containing protein [Phytohalomonas tamaricis]
MTWLEYLLPLVFLTPLAATALIVFALRHLLRRRLRSPLSGQLLRESGQSLRIRLDHAQTMLFLTGALGPIAAMAPLVYGMGRMLFSEEQNWLEWACYGLLSTLAVFIFCAMLITSYTRIRRLRFGLACDLTIAQEVTRLIHPEAHPYFVFHNVPGQGFTIDHLAVTPYGIFVILAKARTRPLDVARDRPVIVDGETLRFPQGEENALLRRTRVISRWLSHYLEQQCGRTIPVCGVLALPGWDVHVATPPEGLLVLSGESLAEQLEAHRFASLDDGTRKTVIHAITQRIHDYQLAV